MTPATTETMKNFLSLNEISKSEKKSIEDLFRLAIDGHLFFYILEKTKFNIPNITEQKFIHLKSDEVERLFANSEIEIEITLDRWLNIIVTFDGITGPLLLGDPSSYNRKVTKEQVFIKKSEIEAYLANLNDPRPEKLKIANRAWNELFSKGIQVLQNRKILSQMEMTKEWLEREMTKEWLKRQIKLGKTPIQQIASLICKDRSTRKIKESIVVEHHDNTSSHPFYALELEIANKCWEELFGDGKKPVYKTGPKKFIEDWLNANYPKLKKNEAERITLTVNPQQTGGSPKI